MLPHQHAQAESSLEGLPILRSRRVEGDAVPDAGSYDPALVPRQVHTQPRAPGNPHPLLRSLPQVFDSVCFDPDPSRIEQIFLISVQPPHDASIGRVRIILVDGNCQRTTERP